MAAKWTDFVAGSVLTAAQLNSVLDNFQDVAIFNETQASGTAGGGSVASTWTKRTLNTTIVNNITGASIASSVITLPAGTFVIQASAPCFESNAFKIRLQNTSDGTSAIIGTSEFDGSSAVATRTFLTGVVTIAATKNFELQHWVQTSRINQGFGVNTSAGVSEIYSIIQITRVA